MTNPFNLDQSKSYQSSDKILELKINWKTSNILFTRKSWTRPRNPSIVYPILLSFRRIPASLLYEITVVHENRNILRSQTIYSLRELAFMIVIVVPSVTTTRFRLIPAVKFSTYETKNNISAKSHN